MKRKVTRRTVYSIHAIIHVIVSGFNIEILD